MSKRPFIHDDFLLGNDWASALYHQFAQYQPIVDFHNHLSPALLAANHEFADLAEIWLGTDHYKWRAMRMNGIPERLITGDAPPSEKFHAWAKTVPYTVRNPLYHWTHLELARHFGITDLLGPENAGQIWDLANAQLPRLRVHDLLELHRVQVLCTTDDPAQPLDLHHQIRQSGLKTRVYPTFRPDKALEIESPSSFNAWLDRLAQTVGASIHTFDDLLSALKQRHDDFHAIGCRCSDHGLTSCYSLPVSHQAASQIFNSVRSGKICLAEEQAAYASFLMLEFGRWNAAKGWAMQLHLGALRHNNSRATEAVGPNTGFDSIGDFPQAQALSRYLDALDSTDELPRTILYNINPADNYIFGAMLGNFHDGSLAGKIQLGSGWWFLDQKEGMEWQLNALSNLGLLRRFVGMVTDSRSFLSFTRHEYFRRVLCNLLGRGIAAGELPDDVPLVGAMVQEICFSNARDFFSFPAQAE
jgi:glucuronate isomerase